MKLYVLVAENGDPVIGEKQDDGTIYFAEDSNFKSIYSIIVRTNAGNISVPIFDEPGITLNDVKFLSLDKFLENKLILGVNGHSTIEALSILCAAEDELDERIHDSFADIACDLMNQASCDDEQESILSDHERSASYINNQGTEAQVKFLLTA